MPNQILSERPLITGMGAALVDLFADVEEPTLDELGSPKGSMTLVDAARADALRAGVKVHTYRPGGSAANTVAGLAGLGMDDDGAWRGRRRLGLDRRQMAARHPSHFRRLWSQKTLKMS